MNDMKLVNIKTVSEFLMVKESTIYSWVHNGSIPFHKLNGLIRFDMDELLVWVKTSKKTNSVVDIEPKSGSISDVNNMVKKAVDSVKGNRYNPSNGKPGQIQGLREEV
jgi:excisionase family DNA binding protein